jgi:tetratricopeptide (TPR) repeat protein
VIPVLVHGAALPAAEQLPESLGPLARCEPAPIQSGSGFAADFQTLLDRLRAEGLRPPEQSFPWQYVLLPAGILAALIGAISFYSYRWSADYDFLLQQVDPAAGLADLRDVREYDVHALTTCDSVQYRSEMQEALWRGLLPLALGPVLIVWGKRRCCLQKESAASDRFYAQGAGRLPTPKSSKSLVCLALGLASFACGPFSAVPTWIVGALAWRELQRHPTWIRGRSLVVTGVLASLIGCWLFTQFQQPRWRLGQWIAQMEAANVWEEEGRAEEATAGFDAATAIETAYPEARYVAQFRRGALMLARQRYDDALADADAVVDALTTMTDDQVLLTEQSAVWRETRRRARELRAAIYDAQGRGAEAQQERETIEREGWQFFPRTRSPLPDDEANDAPPAPAPPAPAPLVDPSAAAPGAQRHVRLRAGLA